MRVVCVSGLFPFPTDIGTAIHVWGLARALDANFDVRFLFLRRPETTAAQEDEVRAQLRGGLEAFDWPRLGSGRAGTASTWGRALARGAPPWVIEEWSAPMARRLAEVATGADAVVFLYDRGLYALSMRPPSPPVVTVRHEIEGWTFREASVRGLEVRERIRTSLAKPLVQRLEGRVLRRSDLVAVTSEEERDRMRTLYGRQADTLVPAAIRQQPGWEPHDGAPAVGYLGSLDYGPNVHGLLRFVSEGWAHVPAPARLVAAGRAPAPEVAALAADARIEVTDVSEEFDSFFPDFLKRIHVAVAPLWTGGAGVKVKTLTMLGSGIPSALTPVAAQGLPVKDGVHCLIAETPRELAGAVARLLADRSMAAELGAAGRELVNANYVWPVVGARFAQFIREELSPPR